MSLGIFVTLASTTSFASGISKSPADVPSALAWFLIAFAIFNTYMLLWSTRVNLAVFGVFLTLEITEILLAIGFFREAHGAERVHHARRWLRGHRHRGRRLVRIRGGRRQQHGAGPGAAGRSAALG
jgi:hypothetical protein